MNKSFFEYWFNDVHNRLMNNPISHLSLVDCSLFRIMNDKPLVWTMPIYSSTKIILEQINMFFQISAKLLHIIP